MTKVRFLGTVFPIDLVTNMGGVPHGTGTNKTTGAQVKWELEIRDSNIAFVVEVDKFDINTELRDLINFAEDVTGVATNLMTLASGESLRPIFHKLIVDDESLHWVHCKDAGFAQHMTAAVKVEDFQKIMKLAVADETLAMCFRDLTDGLRQTKTSAVGAARTMDGICNHFIPDGGRREDGWEPMRKALNVTEPYVKTITKLSKAPRHASWTGPGEAESREIVERAWIILNRYTEYRKRDNQPLSEAEFPILDLANA